MVVRFERWNFLYTIKVLILKKQCTALMGF